MTRNIIIAREMKFENYWGVESYYILSTDGTRLYVSGIVGCNAAILEFKSLIDLIATEN